ncbi:uncharacterized protein LOC111211804 [Brassica napus]|uniref:uncharacterized protein LOC111211804 n=1 Tax=Brassica napus TaxID=3708 RepID=UPI000BBEC2AA|nr:uncharacterized protein LOC111211804 [Brassica napus]
MDSYPYNSHNSNFVDLLNSQQEIVFGLGQESGEVSSSQVPLFGEASRGERKERRTWTPTDDVVLISSWLNTSKDPVVGNEQKSGAFWKRITAYYAASPKMAGSEHREPSHCKQRWHKINDLAGKFCGAYEAAQREKSSGQNENDCDEAAQSSTSEADHATTRPPGVYAAKGIGKQNTKTEGKSVAAFESMWTMKKEDMAMKERLTKMKLLDSLIAKPEPLADYEEELKKKLITDLLL